MSFFCKFKILTRHGCFLNRSSLNQTTTTFNLVGQNLHHIYSYVAVQQSTKTRNSALVLSEPHKRFKRDIVPKNSNGISNSAKSNDKEEIIVKIKATRNKSRQRVYWREEEEQEVIAKEIQLRRENPSITEKEMNKKLSLAFDNSRTTASYASRRKSSRWKLMVKTQNDILDDLNANVEKQKLRINTSKFQDNKLTQISSDQLACNSPSEKTLEEMGDALRYEETYLNILEHEAKGIFLIVILWRFSIYFILVVERRFIW